jgi:AcrR family transcriptional regulator
MTAMPAATAAAKPDAIAERILDAALAEFTEYGLRRVKVDDIARRAGVHRVTVYSRYSSKDEIINAAAITWAQRFFSHIAAAVASDAVDERLVEGFTLCVQTIRHDPLVARLLNTEPEVVLPFITIEGGAVLAAVTAFFVDQIGPSSIADPAGAAELAARIGLSFLLTPASRFPFDTADQIRAFARQHLVPLLTRA